MISKFYLKAGTGEAWAGQDRENIFFVLILNDPRVSDEVENFGLADPIGSEDESLS